MPSEGSLDLTVGYARCRWCHLVASALRIASLVICCISLGAFAVALEKLLLTLRSARKNSSTTAAKPFVSSAAMTFAFRCWSAWINLTKARKVSGVGEFLAFVQHLHLAFGY